MWEGTPFRGHPLQQREQQTMRWMKSAILDEICVVIGAGGVRYIHQEGHGQ